MTRARAGNLAAAIGVVVAVPSIALADVGLPMIVLLWPGAVLALVPIIAIEAAVARRTLGCSWAVAGRMAGVANLVSSAAGVPVVWIILVAVMILGAVLGTAAQAIGVSDSVLNVVLLPFYVAWLPPLEGKLWGPWVVTLAAAIFCAPMYIASVWLESRMARWMLPDWPSDRLQRWAVVANRWTYGLIIGALLAVTLVQLVFPRGQPNQAIQPTRWKDARG